VRLNASGQPEPTQNSASYLYPGKQFISRLTSLTNAPEAELISDPVLSVGSKEFVKIPSSLTPDGRHRNPHLENGMPAGANAFFADGHASWRKFYLLKERYDPHDRSVRWWF
jgi:prepilin-type processing-associated H-X9-DG protein